MRRNMWEVTRKIARRSGAPEGSRGPATSDFASATAVVLDRRYERLLEKCADPDTRIALEAECALGGMQRSCKVR